MSDIVFLDTETLGVHIDAPIWELAAIRRRADGTETTLHLFIHHDPDRWLKDPNFPESFKSDYRERYSEDNDVPRYSAARIIQNFFTGRPHVVGAVPNFDTERIAHQLLRPNDIQEPWHYHLIDVENLAVGYLVSRGADLFARPPWDSNELSRAIGVNPDRFDRHTALGDVRWVMAQWDAIMGAA